MFIKEKTVFRRERHLVEKTESHIVIRLLLLLNLLLNLGGTGGGSSGNGGSDGESGGVSEVGLDLFVRKR